MEQPLLSIQDLVVEFHSRRGPQRATNGVTYDVHRGEVVGVVGESGSGKSVTVAAMMGLLPERGCQVIRGRALFDGIDLLACPERQLRERRGRDLAMIFQDPMTSLNPYLRIGYQIGEAIRVHDRTVSRQEARDRAVELLRLVEVPHAEARVDQYPHEFSGGMRQRAMIAIAIANSPRLLIADEPTTALDVTIQAQVLDVLVTAQQHSGAGMILITHDLGLVAEIAHRVVVMYAGRVVETGPVRDIFERPSHPYTRGLLASLPMVDTDGTEDLYCIPGAPPGPGDTPRGCEFEPRCRLGRGRSRCRQERPDLRHVGTSQHAACHYADEAVGLDLLAEPREVAP